MKDILRWARLVASGPPFRALANAALKARASRLGPGDVLDVGGYHVILDEDDRLGVVVQLFLPQEEVDALALETAREAGLPLPDEGAETAAWREAFHRCLEKVLREEHEVIVFPGPGGEMAFERQIYR